ncbi:hypothetical protein COO60DRAFT_1700999 [Scenedesmus sp. NREL 46B-D3]|nr:hypothetical protein COO60DRAFT_1700999 [Scenedesmus sp. NREL 46B-D3]
MHRATMNQQQASQANRVTGNAQQVLCRQHPAAPAAVPHTALLKDQPQQWRLELFFKSQQELQAQLPFLQSHGITRVNLTNKSNDDQLLQSASLLQANLPGLDLCVHYSLKYNYSRSPAATLAKLQGFHDNLQRMFTQERQGETQRSSQGQRQQQQQQQCHVLLVSGGGKKKVFDTVAALQQLAQQQQQQQLAAAAAAGQPASKRPRTAASSAAPAVANSSGNSSSQPGHYAVAFNPYLPDQAAAAEEVTRLRAKLQTGLVDRVYVQMGTDLQRLSWGLQQLRDLGSELYKDTGSSSSSSSKQPPQLFGSLFIPSKRLLAQMRFRPWSGVHLSDAYLSSVAAAEGVTAQLLAAYAAGGVVPLVESAVKHDAELEHVLKLLQADQQ